MGLIQVNIQLILNQIVEKLKKNYDPMKIMLFGSFAKGNNSEDSDLDILIIKNTNKSPVDRFVEVKDLIYDPDRGIPISPLVLTPAELKKRLSLGDDFIKEILQDGIVLYE